MITVCFSFRFGVPAIFHFNVLLAAMQERDHILRSPFYPHAPFRF
eukprot:gene3742-2638_t